MAERDNKDDPGEPSSFHSSAGHMTSSFTEPCGSIFNVFKKKKTSGEVREGGREREGKREAPLSLRGRNA